ncbi:ketosteroid isomerase-like protein [Rhodoligotrophos appendicifer]|uniref:nuclear transport factor 2 family protein n=1 Tax=Rhodoligotrophos appendicifer TaxID=987056 RepID=UPI001185D200|nr:nuclear transport factor 2 family protein [Rhodoligotrophos appendicifer]
MSVQPSKKALVTEAYSAYGQGNPAPLLALIAPDACFTIQGPDEIFPFSGKHLGRKAILSALALINATFAAKRYTPELILADGDWAAVWVNAQFTDRRSGADVSVDLIDFLRFDGDLIVEAREVFDSAGIIEQASGLKIASLMGASPVLASRITGTG